MYGRIRVSALDGYENVLDYYEVDKDGNVYGKDGVELAKGFNSKGYLQVSLKIKGERRWKKCFVHRLVGLAFVSGRTEEFDEIDHIDTDKLNNHDWNLRWTDHSGNMKNPLTVEVLSESKSIRCWVYDFRLNYVGYFPSLQEAEKGIGYTIHSVDSRIERFYILSKPDLSLVLQINRKYKIQSVVITDIFTNEKHYFYSNREARRFFDGQVNITQAIQKNWTVRGKYKVRNLNYKKLIGTLDL